MISETSLSPEQHQKLSRIVYKESGVVLNEKKYSLLVARLAKRMRIMNISSVSDYIDLISSDPDEFNQFIDATTTNHTFFFRESHHFEHLRKEHTNIWCAASSSGEEPYSIVIDCLEKGFQPFILATDISTQVIRTGQTGIYLHARAV